MKEGLRGGVRDILTVMRRGCRAFQGLRRPRLARSLKFLQFRQGLPDPLSPDYNVLCAEKFKA
jgi:hypothetical protein